jgi:ABC-type Co2+ transport system permease subunit
MTAEHKRRGARSWWYLLFVVQFAVALWPPFYNKVEPTLMGMPFFFWFQLLWVIVSAVFTAVVYLATAD